jgi:hypothetical protein
VSRAGRSRLTIERPGNPGLYMLPAGAPPHWEVIGTVTDADGTGALIRNKATGIYCRYNAGAIRSLVQRKVQAALDAGH